MSFVGFRGEDYRGGIKSLNGEDWRKTNENFADYHTHTLYSHGKGTIQQNVEAAQRKGLKEIAITDHGPGHILYGVKRKTF